MKISLDRIDARSVAVDLGTDGERIVIADAAGLHGLLEAEGDRVQLKDASAEHILLETLRMAFGKVRIEAVRGKLLTLGFAMERTRGALGLALAAEEAQFAEFRLQVGMVSATAEHLHGSGVALGYTEEGGFRLSADVLAASALHVVLGGTEITLGPVRIEGFSLQGGRVAFQRATIESGSIHASFQGSASASARGGEPWIDLSILDAVTGELDVDVDVDLTVPIIGTRKAVHRFRVPIDGGTIDFLGLEGNLSTLENALIDFALREEGLALERVNPLFPARGHGKPFVVWPLSPEDRELAQRNRMRVSVLPQARLVKSDAADEPHGEGVSLRALSLLRLDIRLSLVPVQSLRGKVRLHRADALHLQGNVFYDKTQPGREGLVSGRAEGLALALVAGALSIESIRIAAIESLEVRFEEIKPRSTRLLAKAIELSGGRFEPATPEAPTRVPPTSQ